MAEVVFKGGKIQTGDRVKIPKAIMDTLNLKSGGRIVIKFDPEERRVIVEEEKKKGVRLKKEENE
ncbi:hypothetical protein GF386_05785 [Candidatus Pacearchaeota archaeon]|nr:hypothetical protein [Candidatus Pacearchaeota archaeon]MBD3283604.1 hypothetical protein [Candidatus Pacearchaeota archaeon]